MRRLCLLLVAGGVMAAGEDIRLADFEESTYGDWEVTGEAFGPGPARGALRDQMPVSGFRGRGLVNSFYRGDGTTGTLTSPPFRIERRYLSFLIGGGHHPGKAGMDLLVDGEVVRTATGPNKVPGGTEALEPHAWDVADLAGKTARLRIVDMVTGGWGHINIDEIVLTDRKPPMILRDVQREIEVRERYLHLPVKNGATKRRMSLLHNGKAEREFEIELADGEPDFYVFLDASRWKGQRITLQADRLEEGSRGLEGVTQGPQVPGAAELYREKRRAQFHFSSRRGWLNDPNGLVYQDGDYHLFYQHNPYGRTWGNMHWGHAVSKDLVHWEELPIALYPQRFGDWAFSGSAVVDRGNTSGFKTGKEDPLVAAYTSTGRGECIVFSNDGGRTWTEYGGNPVVKHEGRDPRLLWHEPTRRWVMAVYDEQGPGRAKQQMIAFYTSPDLKEWRYESRVNGYYECPDLFELPVDGNSAQRKWVLLGADGNYAVGSFDGRTFTPEGDKQRGNWGNCFYASQTFSNMPDGRQVQIAWGRVELPGMPFNQMMTFPCELSLRSTPGGPRLAYAPVREIRKLYRSNRRLRAGALTPGVNPLAGMNGELADLTLELEPRDAETIQLVLRGVPVTYDVQKAELTCGDRSAPLPLRDGRLRLRVLADRASLEIFADDGLVYMPMSALPKDGDTTLSLTFTGGPPRLLAGEAHELRSAWRAAQ